MFAQPNLEVRNDSFVGALDYNGVQVATATMTNKYHALEVAAFKQSMKGDGFLLKIAPHVDGSPRTCELVQYKVSNLIVKGAWSGSASLELHPHRLAPVLNLLVLSAIHALTDLSRGDGEVVHDYLGASGSSTWNYESNGSRISGPVSSNSLGAFTVSNHPLKAFALLTSLVAALHPVSAHSYALDGQFDCKSRAHAFIAGLINNRYVDPEPMHVAANSVNAFRSNPGGDLTAFGFRVNEVLGYEQDDEMFRSGAGKALAGPLYGVVVSASFEAVEMRVREAGSNAAVHEVVPLVLTAVTCSPS